MISTLLDHTLRILRGLKEVLSKVDLYRLFLHELKLECHPDCFLGCLFVSDSDYLNGRIREYVRGHWSSSGPLRPPGCGPDSESVWAELDRRCESQLKSCTFCCVLAYRKTSTGDNGVVVHPRSLLSRASREACPAGHILWRCRRCGNL